MLHSRVIPSTNAIQHVQAGAGEQSLVYELTPEVAFSPGTAARETRQ